MRLAAVLQFNQNGRRVLALTMELRRPINLFLRFAFATLLLATGVGKALDVPGFVEVTREYDLLPSFLEWPAALFLIVAEFIISAWLFSGRRLGQAALATIALHLTFSIWVAITLIRGVEVSNCGCFGVFLARPLTNITLIEDTSMTLLACLLYWSRSRKDPI